MLQDSTVPHRIEDSRETKVQDHTWIHMLRSLSDYAKCTPDLMPILMLKLRIQFAYFPCLE
jgi:hypothetical protein